MKFGPELHWLTKVFRRSQKKTFLPVSYVLYEAFYSESAYSKNSHKKNARLSIFVTIIRN